VSALELPELVNGTYRHNKSGKTYEVIGLAVDAETDEILVVYRPIYEHEFGYGLFTRRYSSFVEQVKLEGELRPRFELV